MTTLDQQIGELSPEKRELLLRRTRLAGSAAADDGLRGAAAGASTVPVSPAQRRLWFLDQLSPGNAFYTVFASLRVATAVNHGLFERAVNEIVRRHGSLRTRFAVESGQPVQVVQPALRLDIPLVDLAAHDAPEREATQRGAELARQPFDLAHGPLIRVELLRLGTYDHVVLLALHHIVSDGWSLGVFFKELSALYEVFALSGRSPLPEPAVQYTDYAVWQLGRLQGRLLGDQIAYWQAQLAGMPALELPADRRRPPVQSFRGARLVETWPPELSAAVRRLSQAEGKTLFMTLLAAFAALLARYTGQHDLPIGSPIAGRDRTELEGLIGFFVNTLVLRLDASGDPSFRQLLARVQETTLSAYAHADVPFEMIVERVAPQRDLGRNPLFQVLFQVHEASPGAGSAPGPAQIPFQRETSKFDLTLEVAELDASLEAGFEYSTDLFDADTVAQMAAHLRRLLAAAVADPDTPLSRLPLISDEERTRALVVWNRTAAPIAEGATFHGLVEQQVDRSPEAPAVTCEGATLSYAELDARANALARRLRDLGVGPGARVGIAVPRSLELPVAVLGVMKAGAAYVPLDIEQPRRRLALLIEDAGLEVAVGGPALDGLVQHAVAAGDDADRRRLHDIPAPLAYVLYTSGSTGAPKGVVIGHRGLCNVVAAQRTAFGVGPGDRVLQFASLAFDASIFEIAMALANGAELHLAPAHRVLPGPPLAELLRDREITVATLPPSALLATPEADLPHLRLVTAAGEVCPARVVDRWQPGRRLFNLYGPTEATIWATVAECGGGGEPPTIGRPIANVQAYVLDGRLQPVPIGVAGELHLGGAGLAEGYLGKPELTAERFVASPFTPGDRLYRTGDLARLRRDGAIEYLGRLDHQIKLRGYRVELGEIESALLRHPAVRRAVAVPWHAGDGDARLFAHVELDDGATAASSELRQFLRESLPEHMVPAAVAVLSRMPLTASGKPDRKALPAPSLEPTAGGQPPKGDAERTIAAAFCELLGVAQVSADDNFFDLGGHSLLLVRVQSRLAERWPELTVIDVYHYPTVRSLAAYLEQLQPEGSRLDAVRERGRRRREALPRRQRQ